MNSYKQTKRLEEKAFEGRGSLGCALTPETGISMMKGRLFSFVFSITAILLTAGTVPGSAQVIDCPSGFNTNTTANGACGVSPNGDGADYYSNHSSTLLDLLAEVLAPASIGHSGNSLIKQVPVNVQAFSTTFTFIPNGGNIAFVIENAPKAGIYGMDPNLFSSGAGGEGGFSQFAGGSNTAPSKVFALQFDSYNQMTQASSAFTYSSVQIYQPMQFPSLPVTSGGSGSSYIPEYSTDKVSTSPVPLNSPATTSDSPSGHVYSANLTYDGYTLTLKMFDVTAGETCPGTACFTHSWTGVYIPEIVGGDTAYVGFTAGTSGADLPKGQADVHSIVYTVETATGKPAFTAWNANSTTSTGSAKSSASPVYSVEPGSYSEAQSVAISTSTSPHNYICYTQSESTPAFYPHPDSNGGCSTGTLYTGPITISSTSTLYAMAGSNNSAFALGSANPVGLGPPSTLVAGTYTIGSGGTTTAATPTFSPSGGTLTAAEKVTLKTASTSAAIYYTSDGSTPTVSSSRYVEPVTLDSSTTLKAVAVAAGAADSQIASAEYTVASSSGSAPDCPESGITPYIYTAGKWTEESSATVAATSTLVDLGPQPSTGGTWRWTGPSGYTSTSRQISSIPLTSGTSTYTATYTSSTGCTSTQAFKITVAATAAAVINFASGFAASPTTIAHLGGAYYSDGTIQLTSLASESTSNVYFKTPVNVQKFSTTFTWTAKCPAASTKITCGNGMGFVIISATNPYSPGYWSGGFGSDLSWSSDCTTATKCVPLKSVFVKFDLYNDQTAAPGANLTGYYSGGIYPQAPNAQYNMATAGINMQSGHIMSATLTYSGTVLTEVVTDTTTKATYTNHYTTNIPSLVGGNTAIVGFAGATGAAEAQQNIHSWTYTVE